MKMHRIEVNQIGGFRLGNADDKDAATGCTVIICENGAVGGVDIKGGAPSTIGTDLLKSENNGQKINAVVLSGGSAFGLEACSGVMRYLSAKGIGTKISRDISVPAVCGASLYDFGLGSLRQHIKIARSKIKQHLPVHKYT
jgi:L-aminopeptidase/D-esterase-like protein